MVLLIVVIYALYILWMYKAFVFNLNISNIELYEKLKISIIIAFRNEEKNIISCLQSLISQNYHPENFEIVLCNDHSEDKSIELIEQFISSNPNFKIILVKNSNNEIGKKQAIFNAVKHCNFDILAFTDADCVLGKNWLKCIASAYTQYKDAKMLCGPVTFQKQDKIWEKLMSLEFASLMAITVSSILNKKPFICNAANMAIKKEVFLNSINSIYQKKYSSGDDVFLLHFVKKQFGSNSIYLMNVKESLIYTTAPPNISSFIQQRIRWSSKTIGYSDRFALFSAYLVFIVCLSIAGGIIFSFFYGKLANFVVAIFLIKTFVDALLIHKMLSLLNRKDLLKWIFLEQLFYVFYVPTLTFIALKKTYTWKGRITS
ncbi:MAG: glycosyltransferase [Bacteroidia bacterium]